MTRQTIGPYQILDKLGEGGMGVVYKALDQRLQRFVALKFLTAPGKELEAKRRFLNEARAASALNHPNIVTVYDICDSEAEAHIVMEFVQGKPLSQHICPGGMTIAAAVNYGVQMAEALSVAHAAGIVHRDLKPANVLVTEAGRVKILDFGIAKFRGSEAGDNTASILTQAGTFVGTVAYVSPEQSLGRDVDGRSDIFSLGVVLYEMLTGERPFKGKSPFEIVCEINSSNPRPLRTLRPDIPDALESLIGRMLAKDAAARPQNAAEIVEALRGRHEPAIPSERNSMATGSVSTPGSALAVLRFRDLSGSDSSVADGVASEVVRAMSGVPGIRVASQVASFRFQGGEQDLSEIARTLSTRYILTGSVRHSKNRIRVITELADALGGLQLWSQTFNRETDDFFTAQEDIANAIGASVSGALMRLRSEHATPSASEKVSVQDLVMEAHRAVTHAYHREGILEALELLKRAVRLEPNYAAAHAYLGLYYIQCVVNCSDDVEGDRINAVRAVERAMELAPSDPEVLENSGLVLVQCGRNEEAVHVLRRAVQIAPLDLVAWGYLANALGWGPEAGIKEARSILDRLLRDAPDHPSVPYWLYFKTTVCIRSGAYKEAAECGERSCELQPRFLLAMISHANAEGLAGRFDKTRETMGRLRALAPGATQYWYANELLWVSGSMEAIEPHIAGLVAAGVFKGECKDGGSIRSGAHV